MWVNIAINVEGNMFFFFNYEEVLVVVKVVLVDVCCYQCVVDDCILELIVIVATFNLFS